MPEFNFSTVNDAFGSLANLYLADQKLKNENIAAQNQADFNELMAARDDVTQRVNVTPIAPSTTNVTGSNAGRTSVAGVQMNTTALWVTGGVVGGLVLLKALKVI